MGAADTPDSREIRNMLGLPDADQICIVVRNLRATAEYYTRVLGLGPFVFPHVEYEEITYRGRPSNGYWEMAFARLGAFELELSCPVRSPSIYEDFLNEHGEGLHHVGFDVKNMDEVLRRAEQNGIPVLMSGKTKTGGFAHLDTRSIGGSIFEIIQRAARRA
ncbi:MAG: VOC family protein [Spirochaetia bacterium]